MSSGLNAILFIPPICGDWILRILYAQKGRENAREPLPIVSQLSAEGSKCGCGGGI
jgi:hypothetical protein